MSIEYCYKCDEPTGHAGELEDSLFLWGNPYCDQCWHDIISELPGEYETLKKQLADAKARIAELEGIIEEVRSAYPLGSPDAKGMNDALDVIFEAITRGHEEARQAVEKSGSDAQRR